MTRKLWWCAVPILTAVALMALADTSFGASVRSASGSSGGSRSGGYFYAYPVYYQAVFPSYAGTPTPAYYASNPADNDYAYGASTEMWNNAVLLNLRVSANAEVWLEGSKTAQAGSFRSFVIPPLDPGRDYSYQIRARWMEDGRAIEQTRAVTIRAGDRLTLNLTGRADSGSTSGTAGDDKVKK